MVIEPTTNGLTVTNLILLIYLYFFLHVSTFQAHRKDISTRRRRRARILFEKYILYRIERFILTTHSHFMNPFITFYGVFHISLALEWGWNSNPPIYIIIDGADEITVGLSIF